MKKLSRYNNYVNVDKGVLLFNALTRAYVLLKPSLYNLLLEGNLNELEKTMPKQLGILEENGIVIDDTFDELELVRNLKEWDRFSTGSYHVIINPTLNCNLGCWYCYETHQEGSAISHEIAERVIKNLSFQYNSSPYNRLLLSFFGGEPLLKSNSILYIIEKAKEFASQKDIHLSFDFTTNGTLISSALLESISDTFTSFQITFDGYGPTHNKTRYFKKTEIGSYSSILEGIKKIVSTLTKYMIHIRINLTPESFENLNLLLEDIDFIPKQNCAIKIHQVWQTVFEEQDIDKVELFIHEAQRLGYNVNYNPLDGPKECYANKLSQITINYNGDVYKCTARDFTEKNREGKLIENGSVIWDTRKLIRRLSVEIPQMCQECSLMPACSGICSQTLMETNNPGCHLGSSRERERAILRNYFLNGNLKQQ